MAVVVPLVAAFGSVAGGIAAVGAATTVMGTLAAYASIAGGMLVGVGALSGDKDLMKIGGILGLAGGLTTAFASKGGEAAGVAAAEATSEQAAEKVAESAATTVAENTGGAVVDATGANLASKAFETAGTDAAGKAAMDAAMDAGGAPSNLADRAIQMAGEPNPLDQRLAAGTAGTPLPPSVVDGAKGLTQQDLSAFWEKLKGAGKWLGQNPELLKVGGQMIQGMQQADQMDYQRSLLERARANLNNPIKLGRAAT